MSVTGSYTKDEPYFWFEFSDESVFIIVVNIASLNCFLVLELCLLKVK